jgi:redox-sensitive bicupin YhaK (pirin superfamily)
LTNPFSPIVTAVPQRIGADYVAHGIDLHWLIERASPLIGLTEFHSRGEPFGPRPYAGLSVATYVFEDTHAALRSRDSLGNDLLIEPGGLVWSTAGSGILHQDISAETGKNLHGLRLLINLGAAHKRVPPTVAQLASHDIPEWRANRSDRVRVVAGALGSIASPLETIEPFTLLDGLLENEIEYVVPTGKNALLYVRSGELAIHALRHKKTVPSGKALVVRGDDHPLLIRATRSTHFVLIAGNEIVDPIRVNGTFVMNDQAGIDSAFKRYLSGRMGSLKSLKHG